MTRRYHPYRGRAGRAKLRGLIWALRAGVEHVHPDSMRAAMAQVLCGYDPDFFRPRLGVDIGPNGPVATIIVDDAIPCDLDRSFPIDAGPTELPPYHDVLTRAGWRRRNR